MGFFGSLLGGEIGKLIGGKKHSALGGTLGAVAGNFLPFETGGAVKVAKGKRHRKHFYTRASMFYQRTQNLQKHRRLL